MSSTAADRASASDSPAAPLTHFDAHGQAHMVDVSAKAETPSIARASGVIRMQAATLALIESGTAKKGDVLGVARIAAIQAAKRTADLIPLCHPLPITKVALDLVPDDTLPGIRITATVKYVANTLFDMRVFTHRALGKVDDTLRQAEASVTNVDSWHRPDEPDYAVYTFEMEVEKYTILAIFRQMALGSLESGVNSASAV